MATATLILTDTEDGKFEMEVTFGEQFIQDSQAHTLVATLAESVLNMAKKSGSFTQVEDTAPEVNVEPSNIILPN